jgi:hypothetical protein
MIIFFGIPDMDSKYLDKRTEKSYNKVDMGERHKDRGCSYETRIICRR